MGMGSDPAALDLRQGPLAVLFGALYREAVAFVCDRMGVEVDEIQPDHQVVAASRDLEISAGRIRAGTVAAVINAIPAVIAAPPGVFTPPVFAPFVRWRA